MTSHGSAESRQLARHLLDRETIDVTEESALAAAMQRAYERVSKDLRETFGEDGFAALLVRALSRVQAGSEVLEAMRRVEGSRIHLEVAAGVGGHGAKAAAEALESLITAIVDILSDLIGADMVRHLLVHDGSAQTRDDRRFE
ncbi:MAG TPA: hypothetical protein VN651_08105 [Gemmatimonadaceae bacterium]|nr:hypothetical protein [Gemmatimonadaceae bacterium]